MRQPGYTFLLAGILLGGLMGCGIAGPPIPPEDVGVAPTIARQKAQLKKSGTTQPVENVAAPAVPMEPVEPKGQDEELPPLRPVGTR